MRTRRPGRSVEEADGRWLRAGPPLPGSLLPRREARGRGTRACGCELGNCAPAGRDQAGGSLRAVTYTHTGNSLNEHTSRNEPFSVGIPSWRRSHGWHSPRMRAQLGCNPVVSSRHSATTGYVAGNRPGSRAKRWIGLGPRVACTEFPNSGARFGDVIIPCQFGMGEPDCAPEQLRHQHDDDQHLR